MNKRFKGFTIAELLIALLIISIVLAAAIPTITKRKAGSEAIWQWAETRNSTYFSNIGDQASVIIGNTFRPAGTIMTNNDSETKDIVPSFGNDQDKLIIAKPSPGVYGAGATYTADGHNIPGSSHISFYNVHGVTTKTMSYSGRLALDGSNIGLGMGVLERLQPTSCTGTGSNRTCTPIGNIAIGQYASIANQTGSFNTAIGTKALSLNNQSSFNTMLGYKAGMNTNGSGYNGNNEAQLKVSANFNTGIGSFSMPSNTTGTYNTSLGAFTLNNNTTGSYNTAIGSGSCSASNNTYIGDANICVGYNAGSAIFSRTDSDVTNYKTRYNINFGGTVENKLTRNSLLFIGSDRIPLIGGRMSSIINGSNLVAGRSVNFNTNKFDINTPLVDNVLSITAGDPASNNFVYNTMTFVPYKGMGTYDGLTKLILQGNKDLIQFDYKTGQNKFVPMVFNDGSFSITPDMDDTSVIGKLKFFIKKTGINIFSDVVTSGTDATNAGAYNTISINGSRLLIDKTGKTELRNGAAKSTSVGDAYMVLNNDGAVFLHSKNDKPVVLESSGTNGGILLKDTTASSTPYLTINGEGATFNVPERHNKDNTFMKNIYLDNANTTIFGKVRFEYLKGLPPKVVNGSSLGTGTATNDLVQYMNAIWAAIDVVNQRASAAMTSDARLKNIQGENTAGLKEINALKVKNFTFKNDKEKIPHVGVIAQELQKVFPNSVFEGEDGYLRIRTEEIFYAMVNSIKELCTQIKDLTAKVTGLDNRIKKLEQENAQLKKQNAEFEQRLKKLEAKVK